jgi:hypothetical protein
MAGKKGTDVTDITVEILKEIRDGVRETNERVTETNRRITETNERLDRGFAVVGARIDALGDRIDNVLLGEHREEHLRLRERVSRLEEHLGLTR